MDLLSGKRLSNNNVKNIESRRELKRHTKFLKKIMAKLYKKFVMRLGLIKNAATNWWKFLEPCVRSRYLER